MKKLTKKTLMAIFALVLAVVALGTTTYAWFTVGQTVSTQDIELNVRSEDGLEVRYYAASGVEDDHSAWTQQLTTEKLNEQLAADYGSAMTSFRFNHVTSEDGKVFKTLNTNTTPLSLSSAVSDPKTVGVLEFKLQFRTKAASGTLSWSNVNLTSAAREWAPSVDYTHNRNDFNGASGLVPAGTKLTKYYPHHAARVSVSAGAAAAVVYEEGSIDINTPLSGSTPPAWDKGAHDYFDKLTQKQISGAWPSNGVATTVTDPENTGFSTNFGSANPDGYRDVIVTIRVYLEGFDLDAINGILGGTITLGLEFKLQAA